MPAPQPAPSASTRAMSGADPARCIAPSRPFFAPITYWVALLATGFVACAGSAAPACQSGAECASGVCQASGQCAPVGGDAAGGDLGAVFGGDGSAVRADAAADGTADIGKADGVQGADVAAPGDGGVAAPDAKADASAGSDQVAADAAFPVDTDPQPAACKPNHDGQVVHGEVPIAPGLTVPFQVAENVAVDLKPKTVEGKPTWDLASLPGDAKLAVATLDPAKQWFAKHYPDATYAVQLTKGSPLLGVFRLSAASLDLLGVASPQDGLFATRVSYDPPVPMLQFPLTATSAWATKTTVSGLLDGVLSAWTETVELTAMGQGHLLAPLGAFPVIAVRGRVEKKLGLLATTYRSYAFVAECYGVVGKVDSKANESQPEFTQAAEARRIGP